MAFVYVLYSEKLKKYYIGSCNDLSQRIKEHKNKFFSDSFTASAEDWELVFSAGNLDYSQARRIEAHIKRMKSSKYIKNLTKYESIIAKLKEKYK
jgi:putative endonuclease